MEKNIKIAILILMSFLLCSPGIVASQRKSPKLPWQGTLNGYYDYNHNVGTSYVPESRFSCYNGTCNSTQSNNGVVKDNVTKLYWQSGYPSSTYTWVNAIAYCDNLTLGTYTDWRLPNIKELLSILDNSKYNPSIDTAYFAAINNHYWSSTTYINNSSNAWYVNFSYGNSSNIDTSSTYYVRCVR